MIREKVIDVSQMNLVNELKKERNYAIEILRIISMMMIVSLHFFAYNEAVNSLNVPSISEFLRRGLNSFCAISVNCYILISGYYLLNFRFSFRKLIKLIAEVFLYSVLIYFILVLSGVHKFSLKEAICVFLPTLTREYWFITSYVGVFLLSPILKLIIEKLDQRTHVICIFIGFLLFVLYYNFFFFCDNLNFGGSTGIVWFIYLYICGSYIYRYDFSTLKSNIKKYTLLASLALISQIPFLLLYIIVDKEIFLKGATIFDSVYNSIFVFLSSFFFFKIFTTIKLSINSPIIKKIILFFSSSSLAVYLIHDNQYMRKYIWNVLEFDFSNNPIFLIIYWISTIIGIYLLCSIIDFLRQKTEKVIMKRLDKKITILELKLKHKFRESIEWIINII